MRERLGYFGIWYNMVVIVIKVVLVVNKFLEDDVFKCVVVLVCGIMVFDGFSFGLVGFFYVVGEGVSVEGVFL